MASPWAIALWAALAVAYSVPAGAAVDRSGSFIGYTEGTAACKDLTQDCIERSHSNGCIYNPYFMRTMCPVTCTVEHCVQAGPSRLKHAGHATRSGTEAYKNLTQQLFDISDRHFRLSKPLDVLLTSMGIGTYLGNTDAATDESVISALMFTVTHGWNVIDTASNYRWGRAEISIGKALDVMLAGSTAAAFGSHDLYSNMNSAPLPPPPKSQLYWGQAEPLEEPEVKHQMRSVKATSVHQGGDITRDMLFISTKAGFTTPELVRDLQGEGKLQAGEVVEQMHCISPAYIKASLQVSLKRLKLETVDLLYLHNAAEIQLAKLGKAVFMKRLLEAFTACEELRSAGQIMSYGLATWDCFRQPPGSASHLSLAEVVQVAEQAGGKAHGFKYVQLPVNLGMSESWLEPWQSVGQQNMTFMEAAEALGVGVFSSGPLGEGGLIGTMSEHVPAALELLEISSTGAKMLQWVRSTPGLTTVLVGHKARGNVESNLPVTYFPPLSRLQFRSAYKSIQLSRLHQKHQHEEH